MLLLNPLLCQSSRFGSLIARGNINIRPASDADEWTNDQQEEGRRVSITIPATHSLINITVLCWCSRTGADGGERKGIGRYCMQTRLILHLGMVAVIQFWWKEEEYDKIYSVIRIWCWVMIQGSSSASSLFSSSSSIVWLYVPHASRIR